MLLKYVKIKHDDDTEFFEIDNHLNILALLGIIDEGLFKCQKTGLFGV